MDTKRNILRISAVLLVAFGAGHMVQNMQKNQPGHDARAGSGLGRLEQVVAGPIVIMHSSGARPVPIPDQATPAAQPEQPATAPAASDEQSALVPALSELPRASRS